MGKFGDYSLHFTFLTAREILKTTYGGFARKNTNKEVLKYTNSLLRWRKQKK